MIKKSLNIKHILIHKQYKIISTEDSLKDIIAIEWRENIMNKLKVNNKYEMKNEWLFLDNHKDKTVYCPICGKNLRNNVFTEDGECDSISSGVYCDECKISVYTYKVER